MDLITLSLAKKYTNEQIDSVPSITEAAFVEDDIVFTKDNETTVTLAGAKTALTGPQGETGPTGPQGIPGLTVSVNGVEHVDGDITLTGEDMAVSGTDATPINEALAAKATATRYTVSLSAEDWAGSAAPYTQTVSVVGMLDTDVPKMDVVLSSTLATRTSQREAYACISMIESGAGALTVTCDEEKPIVDLTVQLEVTR